MEQKELETSYYELKILNYVFHNARKRLFLLMLPSIFYFRNYLNQVYVRVLDNHPCCKLLHHWTLQILFNNYIMWLHTFQNSNGVLRFVLIFPLPAESNEHPCFITHMFGFVAMNSSTNFEFSSSLIFRTTFLLVRSIGGSLDNR